MASPWPIQVTPFAPLACGAVLWRTGGAILATIVVKATFGLVHESSARLVAPAAILREDRYRATTGSLEEASEMAPYLPSAGVILHGLAHAPAGHPAEAMTVRLGVFRESSLVNKPLRVLGYRPRESPQAPRPFESIPIVYERAFGGPGRGDNPVGTGAVPGSPLPNIVDPGDPRRRAGFGPISRHWGARRVLFGGLDPKALEQPVAEIPPGIDWACFHAAPPDQQVAFLQGDEWIVLDGLHPAQPHFQTRLPSVRAHARWHLAGATGAGPGRAIELFADTLVITPETQTCSLLWRGQVPLERVEAASRMSVMVGIEMEGYPLAAAFTAGPAEPRGEVPVPSPAPAPRLANAAPQVSLFQRTGDAVMSPFANPLPFKPATASPAPIPIPAPLEAGFEDDETVTTAPHVEALAGKPIAPFTLPEPGARPDARPSPSLPGAPWSPSADGPLVVPTSPPGATTLDIDGYAKQLRALAMPDDRDGYAQQLRAPSMPDDRDGYAQQLRAPAVPEDRDGYAQQLRAPAVPEDRAPPAPVPAPKPQDGALRALVLARLGAREALDDLSLAGADLSGLDFTGAVLVRCDLEGANLQRCKLDDARLCGARLTGADLTDAVLAGADLTGAVLARAVLERARFDGALLADADLSSAKGPGASFARATGRRANFSSGTWDGATFDGLDAPAADFSGALLGGASLRGASLAGVCLEKAGGAAVFDDAGMAEARGRGAHLSGSSFANVEAPRSTWEGAELDDAVFRGARLQGAVLARATCARASFAGADATRADLQRVTADGAVLEGAVLEGADMRRARMHGASFEGARMRDVLAHKADLSKSRFERADLRGANLRSCKLAGAGLSNANLEGADLRDADLEGADLTGASTLNAKMGGASAKGPGGV